MLPRPPRSGAGARQAERVPGGRSAALYNRRVAPRVGYLGLGSNLGEPLEQLRAAVRELRGRSVSVRRLSSVYRTEPVDAPGSPWFLNAVAAVAFEGEPLDLLRVCREVERERGRTRPARNAPRFLDLDLLLVGDEIVRSSELTLPHPRLSKRRFVLVPMVEIAPDTVEPTSGLTMRELLARCEDPSEVIRSCGAAALSTCA